MSTATRDETDRFAARRASGFRPSSRSRIRIIGGALLSLMAIGAIVMIFSTANKRVPVLQLVRDVPAGQQLSGADVRIVEISVDPSLEVVPSGEIAAVVGQYARVRMVAGALLQLPNLQAESLVQPGSAVVAVMVPQGALPIGLAEQSAIELVFPADAAAVEGAEATPPVAGRVVGISATIDPVTGDVSVSVEVAATDAAVVAAANKVRIVLLTPAGGMP